MTLEYAALVAIVAAALVTMQVYMKRGVMGRLRASLDSVGEQYDPRQATTDLTTTSISEQTVTQTLKKDQPITDPITGESVTGDVMVTVSKVNDSTTRTGSDSVGPLSDSLWD